MGQQEGLGRGDKAHRGNSRRGMGCPGLLVKFRVSGTVPSIKINLDSAGMVYCISQTVEWSSGECGKRTGWSNGLCWLSYLPTWESRLQYHLTLSGTAASCLRPPGNEFHRVLKKKKKITLMRRCIRRLIRIKDLHSEFESCRMESIGLRSYHSA